MATLYVQYESITPKCKILLTVTRRQKRKALLVVTLLELLSGPRRIVWLEAYPDVGVLVVPGEVQHVVQSQHARRNLGEVHSWIHMVLRGKWRRRRRRRKWVRLGRC